MIAVGASENGSVEPFSAYGADIVAPDAVAVEGITIEGGTSFSAPYVAGTAALVLSENPTMTPKEVRTTLMVTADDIGPDGVDRRSGYGVVNATRAVKQADETVDERQITKDLLRGPNSFTSVPHPDILRQRGTRADRPIGAQRAV